MGTVKGSHQTPNTLMFRKHSSLPCFFYFSDSHKTSIIIKVWVSGFFFIRCTTTQRKAPGVCSKLAPHVSGKWILSMTLVRFIFWEGAARGWREKDRIEWIKLRDDEIESADDGSAGEAKLIMTLKRHNNCDDSIGRGREAWHEEKIIRCWGRLWCEDLTLSRLHLYGAFDQLFQSAAYL